MKPKVESYLKSVLKEVREVKNRLTKIEELIRIEELSRDDIKYIKIAEREIKEGKFKTSEELKKELGIK
jgi:hypothetical protein